MSKLWACLGLFALLVVACRQDDAKLENDYGPYGLGYPHVAHELLVTFDGLPLEDNPEALDYLESRGAKAVPNTLFPSGAQLIRFEPGRVSLQSEADLLIESRLASWVFANSLIHLDQGVDEVQWALHDPDSDEDIDAPEAWTKTEGCSSVRVAVVDTGIGACSGPTNSDLEPNIWLNPCEDLDHDKTANDHDQKDDVCDPEVSDGHDHPDDYRGWNTMVDSPMTCDNAEHGSQVAGVIGAVKDASGMIGVSPQVTLVPVRSVSGTVVAQDGIAYGALGILYAVRLRVDVINTSWGTGIDHPLLLEAVEAAQAAGILITASAGNGGHDTDSTDYAHFPSGYPNDNVISVAATNQNRELAMDEPWGSSNYGSITVHIGAPGVDIVVTNPDSGEATRGGTSLAAPFVAGVAALLKCHCPGITVPQLRERLLDGDPIVVVDGRSVGSGNRLNANSALSSCPEKPTLVPWWRIFFQRCWCIRLPWRDEPLCWCWWGRPPFSRLSAPRA